MDLVSSCKDKLQYFRIKELKDVLTQLGLSKQGKKQELVDRILAMLVDDQVSKMWAKRHAVCKDEVARIVDDTYRKMQISGATDLATKPQIAPESTPVKPKEEIDDSPQVDMNIRCLCGSSLYTESMIKCVDPKCQMLQHITCVIIPEKPVDGIPPAPSHFYCELCRLSRADPFWLTKSHPLSPVKLMITSMPTDGTNPTQGVEKTFQISRSEKDLLSKQECDVQAWCMLLNDKVPFRMQWPVYAELQVNGVQVRSNNRPVTQALGVNGRDDGPIITLYTKEGINKISLTCCDARLFCLGVRLVKRQTLHQILNMIPKESDGERFEDAVARVRRCLKGGGGGDDADNADSDSDLEVVADSFTVSLRCPMLGSRMRKAGRFKPCVHMGCFDLDAFVEMQQRSRKWQCPICLKNYALEHLIIDPYFNRITNLMRSCDEDTTDIDVKPDGSWRVKGDNAVRDLRLWHLPDSSIWNPSEEVKPKVEASELVKQEVNSLKLGIRKNSNGLWEVSKPTNTILSGERLQENLMRNGAEVIPMSSSATASGKEGEDMSVNQAANLNFDFMANSRRELDSMHQNLDQTYQVSNQNLTALDRDSDVIILSDSDEENDNNRTLPNNSHLHTGGINFPMTHPGLPDAFQEDPTLEAGGSLDLFNDEDFGMHLWQLPSTSQAGPSFQLFGSDTAAASDPLTNFHQSPMNYPNSMNIYPFAPESSVNPATFLPGSTVGHSNNNDINDGLVDNPLAFGIEDPSLKIFLPPRPSGPSGQTNLRHQQNSSSGFQSLLDTSLRLGDGSGQNHMEPTASQGLNAGHVLHSEDGTMQSLVEAASLFSNDTRTDKTARQRSGSPSPFPRPQRTVRPRLVLSIETDSE